MIIITKLREVEASKSNDFDSHQKSMTSKSLDFDSHQNSLNSEVSETSRNRRCLKQ